VTTFDGLLHVVCTECAEPRASTVIDCQEIDGCFTADEIARDAAPGPWSYHMSPFHTEAVIEGPEGGTLAHLGRTLPRKKTEASQPKKSSAWAASRRRCT
jgi:hypothetical protein